MPIYIVVPLTYDSSRLDAAVSLKFDEQTRFQLQHVRGWLVQHPGTTVEVSNYIGISNTDRTIPPETDSAIVTPVTSYYGRGPTDMWEWLSNRMDK